MWVQWHLFDVRATYLNSCFRKTQSLSEMNSLRFNLHITGQRSATRRPTDTTHYAGPHVMPAFLPSVGHCALRTQGGVPQVFAGRDRNICIWESSRLNKYTGVGRTLALDFPAPWSTLRISHLEPTLWLARAETCQVLTFSSNVFYERSLWSKNYQHEAWPKSQIQS